MSSTVVLSERPLAARIAMDRRAVHALKSVGARLPTHSWRGRWVVTARPMVITASAVTPASDSR